MLNYLILGSDGVLGGYDRADILLCDLATNEEPQMIWRRTDELRSRFAPSSVDEVKRDAESARLYAANDVIQHTGREA